MRVCENLWLNDHYAAESMEYRESHGIEAILSVLRDRSVVDDNGIVRLRVSPPDGPGFGPGHIDLACRFLESVHKQWGLATLVHCWGGSSRSVSVVTTYLHLNPDAVRDPICDFGDMDVAACRLRELRGVGYTLPHPHIWGICKEYVISRNA